MGGRYVRACLGHDGTRSRHADEGVGLQLPQDALQDLAVLLQEVRQNVVDVTADCLVLWCPHLLVVG